MILFFIQFFRPTFLINFDCKSFFFIIINGFRSISHRIIYTQFLVLLLFKPFKCPPWRLYFDYWLLNLTVCCFSCIKINIWWIINIWFLSKLVLFLNWSLNILVSFNFGSICLKFHPYMMWNFNIRRFNFRNIVNIITIQLSDPIV